MHAQVAAREGSRGERVGEGMDLAVRHNICTPPSWAAQPRRRRTPVRSRLGICPLSRTTVTVPWSIVDDYLLHHKTIWPPANSTSLPRRCAAQLVQKGAKLPLLTSPCNHCFLRSLERHDAHLMGCAMARRPWSVAARRAGWSPWPGD